MVEFIKKTLIVLSVVANLVLAVMYARIEAQFTTYRYFMDNTMKHEKQEIPQVPNLPTLPLAK